MKRKWLSLALAAIASAGVAFATEYTDSSANYAEGWATGSNGGEGFGAWTIATTSGSDGWAGSGIWDPAANEFKGSWDGKTQAFGMIGKGGGFSVTASRAFRAALATGDSFQLDMGVNWDANIDGAHKGFVLTAGGKVILEINHGNFPGHIYVNGDDSCDTWNEAPDPEEGEVLYPMTWKFTAKDATTLTVSANSRKDASDVFEKDITVETSAIDGFRLQSVEQDNQNEDRRQSYYDNFVLDIAGELPELVTLGLMSDDWAVTSASQTLYYTLTRSSSAGALDVTISSSDESFVAGKTVSFDDGEEAVKFELEATLTGSGNFATITASATGCDPASYEVKGPQYRLSVEKYEADPNETINFWMNWDDNGIALDEAKVTIEANPADSMELPTEWTWNTEEGGAYVASSFVALSSGTLILKYDGVQFADYGVTVVEAGATLSGPTSIRVGVPTTYTLDVTLPTGMTDSLGLEAEGTAEVVIEPDTARELEASGTLEFTVTAVGPGTVTLTPFDTEGLSFNELVVTVTEAPDYDDYLAYDDATLYPEGFDTATHGAGQNGFEVWSVYQAEAENGGVFVGDSVPESLSGILEAGKVLGLYANGSWENNNYKMYRGFGGDIGPGQEFAIDFACEATGGSRFVQVVRLWDGVGYPRFEVYTSDGHVGVNLEGFEVGDIGWEPAARVVHLSVYLSADGSTYTLSLTSGSDVWNQDVPVSTENWGDGLQGFIIGAWNSGSDLYFNRMTLEQVEEPVVERAIGWAAGVWNPDAAGEYNFAISATTEDIGEVALSVTPAEGALSLSTDTVDLTGVTEASFTVSLSEANEGDSFVITATPADTSVAPIEYNVTVSATYVTLSSDAWEYPVSAGEIWLGLSASVSKYGTYAITSSDEAVLAVPEASEAIAVGSPDPSWFNVTIVGPGTATIYATAEGEETPAAEYTFTVIADAPSIDGTTIEVSFADGDGLSGKVDDTLRDQFTNVKAQVLQWNGVDAFDEVEVLENEAEWPDMQFTPSIDNPVIRLIFVK